MRAGGTRNDAESGRGIDRCSGIAEHRVVENVEGLRLNAETERIVDRERTLQRSVVVPIEGANKRIAARRSIRADSRRRESAGVEPLGGGLDTTRWRQSNAALNGFTLGSCPRSFASRSGVPGLFAAGTRESVCGIVPGGWRCALLS